MAKREPDGAGPPSFRRSAACTIRRRSGTSEAAAHHASDWGNGGAAPSSADRDEAWAIAMDLIADLGAVDAVAWADHYMDGLRRKRDLRGMQRWGIVTAALGELAPARVH